MKCVLSYEIVVHRVPDGVENMHFHISWRECWDSSCRFQSLRLPNSLKQDGNVQPYGRVCRFMCFLGGGQLVGYQ